MHASQNEQTYVTTHQLSVRLQVHPRTIMRAIADGKLDAARVGRLVRIPEAAVERYLEAQAAPRHAANRPPITVVASAGPRRRTGRQMPLIGPPRRRG
jgi:excisionase family DNA binding protein